MNGFWKTPKIIFSGSGEGVNGKTLLLISIHKNFTEFSAFTRELRSSFGLKVA
jgi:hypothetical protein